MVNEEYLDETDIEIENDFVAEDAQDQRDEVSFDTSPTAVEKDDLYSLFWKVVRTEQSSKVGNVTKEELGMFDISIRDCQRIAIIGRTFGHKGFAEYFENLAEVTLSTSASKDGWLPELFVSQKKFSTKKKGADMSANFGLQKSKKKGLFNFKK